MFDETPTVPETQQLLQRMIEGKESFWKVVHKPFMSHDLTREQLKFIVSAGLQRTYGQYTQVVALFGMPREDYKRFLNFLNAHECHVPFMQFRQALRRIA